MSCSTDSIFSCGHEDVLRIVHLTQNLIVNMVLERAEGVWNVSASILRSIALFVTAVFSSAFVGDHVSLSYVMVSNSGVLKKRALSPELHALRTSTVL